MISDTQQSNTIRDKWLNADDRDIMKMHMNDESLTEKSPTISSDTLIDLLILLNRNNQMKLCSLNHFNLTLKEILHTQMKKRTVKKWHKFNCLCN